MSDDLATLGGMITPPPTQDGLPASFDTGTVTAVVDTTHVKVDLGDKSVTAFVPETLTGAPIVDSAVQVGAQENTFTVQSVISGAGAGTVPIGSVVMWATATPPAGWLLLDGSTYSSATYPVLFSVLGTTTLPNMADRFPIGVSGTKAVKTTGGSATVTLTEANLASHDHSMAHTHEHVHTHNIAHTHEHNHTHNLSHTHTIPYGVGSFNNGTGALIDGAVTGGLTNTSAASTSITASPSDSTTSGASTTISAGASDPTTGGSSAANTGLAGSGTAVTVLNPYLALNFIIKAT